MDGVPAIDKKSLRIASALGFDECREFGDATFGGAGGEVVVREDVAVEVCGDEQGYGYRIGRDERQNSEERKEETAV